MSTVIYLKRILSKIISELALGVRYLTYFMMHFNENFPHVETYQEKLLPRSLAYKTSSILPGRVAHPPHHAMRWRDTGIVHSTAVRKKTANSSIKRKILARKEAFPLLWFLLPSHDHGPIFSQPMLSLRQGWRLVTAKARLSWDPSSGPRDAFISQPCDSNHLEVEVPREMKGPIACRSRVAAIAQGCGAEKERKGKERRLPQQLEISWQGPC